MPMASISSIQAGSRWTDPADHRHKSHGPQAIVARACFATGSDVQCSGGRKSGKQEFIRAMRILLVEDDSLLGKGVAAGLVQAGWAVDWVVDGLDAEAALRTNSYDSIVLDLGLPGIDGLTLLGRLRATKDSTPVLVLTARDTLADRIAGLDAGGDDKKKSYTAIAETTNIPIVSRTFLEMADVPEKTLGAYVSVIQGSGLELWNDPAVDRVTSASDFDFSTFRRDPQSLYIVVQPEHLKTLAPLVRLLFADAIASLQRRELGPDEPHAVMFLMDEFDQLGRQPLVLSSIKTIRSFGGRFFIISQTIPGLDDIYGETGRRSLQGGAGVQIYMTPQDDRTADVLSNALGRSTITAVTESQSRVRALEDSANVSRRSEERPLISANELLRFPLGEVLVLPEGQYPIRAQHIRYYEDRHFGPIDRARKGKALPTTRGSGADGRQVAVGKLSGLAASVERADAEVFGEAARVFQSIAESAKRARKVPARA